MKNANCVILILLLVTVGCATKQTSFYLVPDPEGKVGEVTVTNTAGKATLTKANETVGAPRADKPFSVSREATSQEIQTKFGETLSSMPPAPTGFTVYFDSDSSKVKADSLPVIDKVLAEIKKRDSHDISVNGHTDRTGEAAYNMKLSLSRASTVKDLLVKQGVPQESISVEYYGESKPVIPTAKGVNEPKNRRVEVVVR